MLTQQLGLLNEEFQRRNGKQNAAVEEANRRRRAAAGRPVHQPWPRSGGGSDLSLQTVNGWLPKKRSSAEPSVPSDFEDLWAVIAVMLEATGTPPDARQRRHWKRLHQDARLPEAGLDDEVRGYLDAARKSAEQHPYSGLAGRAGPPPLADVYVHQQNQAADRDEVPAEPAEALFGRNDRLCLLIAGPGGGKSTLLRARLRAAANAWNDGKVPARRLDRTVPVWVSARGLAGDDVTVADALAGATRSLSRFGPSPGLPATRFLKRPCPGAFWQVLVDGLDELPGAERRREVLEKLRNAATQDPSLYRCVVATRPLTEYELIPVGSGVPRYQLQPFTPGDLDAYIAKYFAYRWPEPEATHRSRRFAAALREAFLHELAESPLMAFILCQLYLAHPDRPLPAGRHAVYETFTELLYESNAHKQVADSHEAAITHLVQSLQSPAARQAAEAAARQVHERLPQLIDYLAHRWHTGPKDPAAVVLANHEAVQRPGKVQPHVWQDFVESLLGHTGLLVHLPDGLGFPHQTFLEYHAARHATRDEQARSDALRSGRLLSAPEAELSYAGFLLDALLSAPGDAPLEVTRMVEAATRIGGTDDCRFLVAQVNLQTQLPTVPTARQLLRFSESADLLGVDRIRAAAALVWVDGHRELAAARLIALAHDPALYASDCAYAAERLSRLEGYRTAGADRLIALADDPTLDANDCTYAAERLSGVEGYRTAGASRLAALADDPTLVSNDRRHAAERLSEVEGYRTAGADRLIALADDLTLSGLARAEAARLLAGMEGYQKPGADRLIALAEDPSLDAFDRETVARYLWRVNGFRGAGASRRAAVTGDAVSDQAQRNATAEALAKRSGGQAD
ncbi:NACHT domain-containing protein [Mangrovactinospora gilvigrisea]|uniref:NACHT domain-containing protein n=1 Tax=Mangrovactinospora gilvigrisea TaxID=1428644 RepID=UPI001114B2A8|nr:hypothetical protein [Mangrovactinospora gilvigrisea]